MRKQIEHAVDTIQSLSKEKQGGVKRILGRYIKGEIGLDEAYYELLDGDLIPMPQRCGMYAKPQMTAEDEKELKNHVSKKLFG